MESPRKFNDCYFYYYSTCTKGDNCVFRHEPSALGCETMCTAWQQGKCLDKRCKLRHMELRKNRKQIPCYWENQPGGCRKKHCPFMHKNPDARTDGIAPSQPAPHGQVQVVSANADLMVDGPQLSAGVQAPVPTAPAPAPAPVPLLWQQQRQVVLDSAILGVLPPSSELLGVGPRRVLPPHEAPPNPYAAMPVDPLVVNFEEESDNESVPSSTPTKMVSPDDCQRVSRTKSQEILLLEKIQAEAAAFYSYEEPAAHPQHQTMVPRTNLSIKYDRLSLDEISGKKQNLVDTKRNSLDFKILSLDEIRAKKKVNNESIVQTKPITLNLTRKRNITQETITRSGKMIKVVRNNSVVYKSFKVSNNGDANKNKNEVNASESDNSIESRKRTMSEQSDIDVDERELDDCFNFKKIKLVEQRTKPKLIRNRNIVNREYDIKECEIDLNRTDDSDTEVQIVDVDEPSKVLGRLNSIDSDEVIELSSLNTTEVIDLSEFEESVELTEINREKDSSNIPDVVASCVTAENKVASDKDLMKEIDDILSGDSL